MTGPEKRAWVYGLAWLGGGIAAGGILAWLIWIVAYDPWPDGTAEQRLGILGQISIGALVLMGLVMVGLSIRNAIRNLKGSIGAASFEANGHDREPGQ